MLAILLAIAPAMAGFLLFDATRGMAQGWLGAMAAAALAPLFVLMVAAVEFAILTPMIATIARRAGRRHIRKFGSVMPIGLVDNCLRHRTGLRGSGGRTDRATASACRSAGRLRIAGSDSTTERGD